MAAPPQGPGQMMPPQPYPGMYYQPMTPENMLSRRNLWFANAFALVLIWLGFIFRLISRTDPTVFSIAVFLAITGGVLGALASTAGALGSRKTSDIQNIGLFLWAGLLLLSVALMTAGFV